MSKRILHNGFFSSLKERGVPYPSVLIPLIIIAAIGLIAYSFMNPYPTLTPTSNTRVINLKVLDQTGHAINGATVSLFVNDKQLEPKTTIYDGTATFVTDSNAVLKVNVQATGFLSYSGPVSLIGHNSYQITLTQTQAENPLFSILVTDQNGQPIQGAHATLVFEDKSTFSAYSDKNGNVVFQLPYALRTSSAELIVEANKYQQQPITFITPNDVNPYQTLQIRLSPLPTLQEKQGNLNVTVFDDSGNPASRIKVNILDFNNGTVMRTGLTDSEGLVVFRDFAIGAYFYISAQDMSGVFQNYSSSSYYQFDLASTYEVHLNQTSS